MFVTPGLPVERPASYFVDNIVARRYVDAAPATLDNLGVKRQTGPEQAPDGYYSIQVKYSNVLFDDYDLSGTSIRVRVMTRPAVGASLERQADSLPAF